MIKKYVLCFMCACALSLTSACTELELGSHIAKTMSGQQTQTVVGDFKVGNPYRIKGRTYYPKEKYEFTETGIASWYGPGFHGKLTANGEIFNENDLTAAHRTLQMPSMIRVTNLQNGRSLILRVNDRGPFAHDRVLDVSKKAAEVLGFKRAGTARVRIDVMEDESRIVASAAKRGISTRGTEVALNRNQSIGDLRVASPMPTSKPYDSRAVQMATVIQQPQPSFEDRVLNKVTQKPVSSHYRVANLEPISKPVASPNTQDVFVQTGAFSNEDNALTFKTALYNIEEPVNVYRNVETNGDILYRVKIGPLRSVEKADEILNMLQRQGRDAKIVLAVK
jgi:rare lipoprotein A